MWCFLSPCCCRIFNRTDICRWYVALFAFKLVNNQSIKRWVEKNVLYHILCHVHIKMQRIIFPIGLQRCRKSQLMRQLRLLSSYSCLHRSKTTSTQVISVSTMICSSPALPRCQLFNTWIVPPQSNAGSDGAVRRSWCFNHLNNTFWYVE